MSDQSHDHASTHHKATDPFTPQQRIMINTINKTQKFEAHHHGHHGHHQHVNYKRPKQLTVPIGLYALKKINAMNPDILTEHEKRLLQPAAPGILTNLIHGLLIFSAPAYAFSVWANHGIKTLIRPTAFLPLAAIVGGDFVFQRVSSSARELLWGQSRADLVNSYKAKWGEDYLLDSLNPVFRLPDKHE